MEKDGFLKNLLNMFNTSRQDNVSDNANAIPQDDANPENLIDTSWSGYATK